MRPSRGAQALSRRLVKAVLRALLGVVLALGLSSVAVLLRVFAYRGTVRVLSRLSPEPAMKHPSTWMHRFAAFVGGSGKFWYGFRFRCLHRSLLLWWVLRWRGVPAEIHSGVALDPQGGVNIHAWVEANGAPLGDSRRNVSRFTRLWPELVAGRE